MRTLLRLLAVSLDWPGHQSHRQGMTAPSAGRSVTEKILKAQTIFLRVSQHALSLRALLCA